MKLLPTLLLATLPLAAAGNLKWETDLPTALKRAQAEKKQVFLDIWAEWCGPCQYLKKEVFPTPEAEAALSNYIPVAVMVQSKDGKTFPEARKVADGFNLKGYPTMLILDASGKELRRQVGAFRTGKDLAAWLKQ